MKQFIPAEALPIEIYNQLCKLKVENPELVFKKAKIRKKSESFGNQNKVLIVAADHNGRMITAYNGDEIKLGNRYEYLARICRLLSGNVIDGIEATPDIIEDLILLDYLFKENNRQGFIDNITLIGTVNRGGLLDTAWELDDRPLSFTVEGIKGLFLDGLKMMFRIKKNNLQSGKTLKYCAEIINQAYQNKLPVFIEGLYIKDEKKCMELDLHSEALVKIIGISQALGTSAVQKWLEVPFNSDFQRVSLATSGPILVIQEEKEREPKKIVEEYCQGVDISHNIYGTLIGRNVLFAEEDPLPLAQAISAIWKDDLNIDLAIKKYFEN